MAGLISDVEALLDHLNICDCFFVGLSIGGMIAQSLATKRLDLIRAMALSNTAAKIATPAIWPDRIDSKPNRHLSSNRHDHEPLV